MVNRFQGEDGKRRLVELLKSSHSIVACDEIVAKKIAESLKIIEKDKDEVLIEQGSVDNDAYFILIGSVEIYVNGNLVATRTAGDVVGEMAALNHGQKRSATVRTAEPSCFGVLDEGALNRIANEHSSIWKNMAIVLAHRLCERGDKLRPANTKPHLFIGCSVESLKIAEAIHLALEHAHIEVKIWDGGVFQPSDYTIEDLEKELGKADFGAFILGPDDKTTSRSSTFNAPRDNVILELGMFMGKIGRNRTFYLYPRESNIKIPSDLLGITPIEYYPVGEEDDIDSKLRPACVKMKRRIAELGPR